MPAPEGWVNLNNRVAKDWGKKKAWNKGKTKVDQSDCKPGEKRCSMCGKKKTLKNDYYKDKRTYDGYYARCKDCHNGYAKRDPERARMYKRNWYHRQVKKERRAQMLVEMYEERQQPARIRLEELRELYM
jgi:hypothetical protein